MKRTFIVLAFIMVSLLILGCEESSPTKNSGKTYVPTIQDMVGTYQLSHYQVQYANGTTINEQSPGVSVSGTMTIDAGGEILQTINLNGRISNYADKITKIHNDSVMTLTLGTLQSDTKYSFDQINLTLILQETDEEIGLVILTEIWKRMSMVVQKTDAATIQSAKPSTAGILAVSEITGKNSGALSRTPLTIPLEITASIPPPPDR